MNLKKLFYAILEQMVRSAKKGDKNRILRLNAEFEKLRPEVFPNLSDTLWLEYDLCRQSCVMSADSKFTGKRDEFVADALQRFRRIQKP